jgi:hypothetical protein
MTWRNWFFSLFCVSLLTTEFFFIDIAGGVAHIYQFYAVGVVLLLATSVLSLFRSKVFLALLLFAMVNGVAAMLSDTPSAAFASLMANYANLAIVIAVAVMLRSGRMTIKQMYKMILVLTVINVVWGIIQVVAHKFGILLALTDAQASQISLGLGPGFRSEADTLCKYLVLPFLLFLPNFLHDRRRWQLRVAYGIMAIGLLMDFTRTAVYGLAAALVFGYLWYIFKGQSSRVTTRFLAISAAALLGLTLILNDSIPISEYVRFKVQNLFNQQEIVSGGSSHYRLDSMNAVLESTLESGKRELIGNGWGQIHVYLQGEGRLTQVGGGDGIVVFGYSGLIGVAVYLLYTVLAFGAAARLAWRRDYTYHTLFSEGVMFALFGMFVTGQMAGYLIAPEYHMLLGICVYLSLIPSALSVNIMRQR